MNLRELVGEITEHDNQALYLPELPEGYCYSFSTTMNPLNSDDIAKRDAEGWEHVSTEIVPFVSPIPFLNVCQRHIFRRKNLKAN